MRALLLGGKMRAHTSRTEVQKIKVETEIDKLIDGVGRRVLYTLPTAHIHAKQQHNKSLTFLVLLSLPLSEVARGAAGLSKSVEGE